MEIIEFLWVVVWFLSLWDPKIHLPNSTFRSCFFFIFHEGPTCKSSTPTSFTNQFTSLLHTGDVNENHWKSMETWKSVHFIKNRPSHETFIFISYSPPKINDLDDPRDTPQTAPRSPGASLGDPWSTLGPRRPPRDPRGTPRAPSRAQNSTIRSNIARWRVWAQRFWIQFSDFHETRNIS